MAAPWTFISTRKIARAAAIIWYAKASALGCLILEPLLIPGMNARSWKIYEPLLPNSGIGVLRPQEKIDERLCDGICGGSFFDSIHGCCSILLFRRMHAVTVIEIR